MKGAPHLYFRVEAIAIGKTNCMTNDVYKGFTVYNALVCIGLKCKKKHASIHDTACIKMLKVLRNYFKLLPEQESVQEYLFQRSVIS